MIPVVIEGHHLDPRQRLGSQQVRAGEVDRPLHFLYSACTDENRPNDPTQGGERSQSSAKNR